MSWKAVCERDHVQRGVALPIAKDWKKTADGEPGFICRLRARDATAFREVVESYQNKVFSFVFHIAANRGVADAISVSVFAEFHASIQRFSAEGEILPFLYRVAMRLSCGYVRTSRKRPSGATAAEAGRKDLVELLSALTEEERVLLLLREMERYVVADLAILFSADEGIIRARLLRARQKLLQRNPTDALSSH